MDELLTSGRIDFEQEPTLEFEGRQHPLHDGQRQVWNLNSRFIANPAGWQAGKTETAVYWLMREIQRCGTGDYAVFGPTLPILNIKVVPIFNKILGLKYDLGEYKEQKKRFELSKRGLEMVFGPGDHEPTNIYFKNAEDPNALEAATYKAAVGEELGAPSVPIGSWEVIQSRLAVHQGRMLFTSRPYSYDHWYYREVYDKADYKWSWQILKEGGEPQILTSGDVGGRIGVINYSSLMNPAFPKAEYWLQKQSMPPHRHALKYDGLFTKPEGVIYDCFERELNVVKPFDIPEHWPRHIGVDFGEVNTAAVFLAESPNTLELFAFGTYHAGGRTEEEHTAAIREKVAKLLGYNLPDDWDFTHAVGGSWSEGEQRSEYVAAGLPLGKPPIREVEVGVQRVYRQYKTRKLKVFDTCAKLIDETEAYSRKVDDRGEPTEKIKDKEKYHRLDALRYIISLLRPSAEIELAVKSRLVVAKEPTVTATTPEERNARILEREAEEEPQMKSLRRIV